MFNIIKKYVKILDEYNNSSNEIEINKVFEKLNNFENSNLGLNHKEIFKIEEINNSEKFGYYIKYNGNISISKKGIFNNINELQNFISENFDIIKNTGGLNFYFIGDNQKNIFFQIHYQDEIIKFIKNK